MRYTTLIDISEWPELYQNVNVRCVYLHLVLRSGYHDDDRDKIRTSLRRVALQTGCTLAAVRHAVKVLQSHGLLKIEGPTWQVTKWVIGQNITSRAQQRAQAAAASKTAEQQQRARERELKDMERERQTAAAKLSDEERQEVLQDLQSGKFSTLSRLTKHKQ